MGGTQTIKGTGILYHTIGCRLPFLFPERTVIKLAVRYRKYFPQCKPIPCNGRPNKRYCPSDRPKKSNGEFKDCGAWAIDYRELDGRWVSKIFPGINKTQAIELYEEIKSNIRRKMVGLPTIVKKPTFAEYATETYLALCKNDKRNTFLLKRSATNSLVKHLVE